MTTQQPDSLKGKLIASTMIHVGALLVLYFGVPSLFHKPPPVLPWRPVPIDIVEIGDITNTRIRGENDTEQTARISPPENKQVQSAPPAPEVKPPEPAPPAPKPAEKPPAPAAPAPDELALPTPHAKPKPPESKPSDTPKPPSAEELKNQQQKQQQQQQSDPLASVLKNVAKLKPSERAIPDARIGDHRAEGESKTGTASGGYGPALGDRLTISQEDSLRRQISSCWNMPIGARNAQDLIVEVLIDVNEDRTVRSAQVVDQARMASDSHFRAAAEAALRALRSPKCSPLMLPEGQYEQWKTIRFNFDPRDML